MNPKQRAADAALKYVESGMVVGLGTGSTADQFLRALAAAIAAGTLTGIRGVPTSLQSERRARELGIPLSTLAETPRPDVTVDGADEVDPNLDLIKGLGGALLREKIVAQNSAKLVIIADAGKVVERLGTRAMLPVEVVTFAHEVQVPFLRNLGAEPVLRVAADGSPFVTDNGNHIYDCRFPDGIADPQRVEQSLKRRAGIVETGLFLGIAAVAFVADEDHAEECTRESCAIA
ncbi:MAG: ribose 5-phosphate isomerase [Phycisphaerales bacterium]|nr:ribose 5-phosphate isomerase [Phycisphaerales bacterium]